MRLCLLVVKQGSGKQPNPNHMTEVKINVGGAPYIGVLQYCNYANVGFYTTDNWQRAKADWNIFNFHPKTPPENDILWLGVVGCFLLPIPQDSLQPFIFWIVHWTKWTHCLAPVMLGFLLVEVCENIGVGGQFQSCPSESINPAGLGSL